MKTKTKKRRSLSKTQAPKTYYKKGDGDFIVKDVAGIKTGFVIRPTQSPRHLMIDVVPLTKSGRVGEPTKGIRVELDIRKQSEGFVKVDGKKVADLHSILAPKSVQPSSSTSIGSAILKGGKVVVKSGANVLTNGAIGIIWLVNAVTVCLNILLGTVKVAGIGLAIYTLWNWGLLSKPVALASLGIKVFKSAISVNPFVTYLTDIAMANSDLSEIAKDILIAMTLD